MWYTYLRLAMSHMRMVLSADADSKRSPVTSTAHTISSWP